jgi:AcrR family transcriptional regulator
MGNRERIIEVCRQQMNQSGAHTIGTAQLCDSLSISPGNLYYHFRNKEEIIRALFDEMDVEFRRTFEGAKSSKISPVDYCQYYLQTLEIAWRHKFFFSDLPHLLRRDRLLAKDYRALQDWALDQLENIVRQVADEGNLVAPRGAAGYRSIAVNTWLIWNSWIPFAESMNADGEATRADMHQGVAQIFDAVSAYLAPEFERAVRNHLTKARGKPAVAQKM